MKRRFRNRVTFANVVALIALFVAIGGTGVASPVAQRAASIGGEVKKALKLGKSANRKANQALRAAKRAEQQASQVNAKAAPGPKGERGPSGRQGLTGPPGVKGDQGPEGPSALKAWANIGRDAQIIASSGNVSAQKRDDLGVGVIDVAIAGPRLDTCAFLASPTDYAREGDNTATFQVSQADDPGELRVTHTATLGFNLVHRGFSVAVFC